MVETLKKRIEITEETPEILIAVYGTLLSEEHNHYLLGNSECLGIFKSEPKYTMFSAGGFPILSERGDTSITFEVYKITSNRIMEQLHSLEGCNGNFDDEENSWYTLKEIETPLNQQCFIYVQNKIDGNEDRIIINGDWKIENFKI